MKELYWVCLLLTSALAILGSKEFKICSYDEQWKLLPFVDWRLEALDCLIAMTVCSSAPPYTSSCFVEMSGSGCPRFPVHLLLPPGCWDLKSGAPAPTCVLLRKVKRHCLLWPPTQNFPTGVFELQFNARFSFWYFGFGNFFFAFLAILEL